MKKIFIVGSALMLVSTATFASKARLQSLGEDKDGSYYISDYRNVYINPSELNTFGNKVFFEWGNAGKAVGNGSLDTDSKTKAQGGMFYALPNDMKAGVILGDETDVAALTRILSSNGSNSFMQTADNVIDLFLAGKGDVNWGANLLYTQSESEVTNSRYKQNAYALRAGANKDAWNAHLLLALGAKADAPDLTNTPTYKGKLGVRVGGGYDLDESNKAFAMYERYEWKQDNGNTAERIGSFNKWFTGVGHTKKITDSSTFFARLQAEMTNIKLETSTGNNTEAKITRFAVPLTVAFEHSATEWLVLRGSVGQNIHGTVEDQGLTANFGAGNGPTIRNLAAARYGSSTAGNGGKKSIVNSTVVNAGMTFKFGNLELDGNIGTTDGNRAIADTATTEAADTKHGVLAFDNLMTRVGMTYNF